jgi:hypothetical protein
MDSILPGKARRLQRLLGVVPQSDLNVLSQITHILGLRVCYELLVNYGIWKENRIPVMSVMTNGALSLPT